MLSRRAWLRAVFGASLGASLAAGCRREVAPHITGALLGQSAHVGHLLRDGAEQRARAAWALAPERTDTVIIGGGPAGLATAWELARRGHERFVLLDLEPALGGTALGGASPVTAYPWGAHYVPVPHAHNRDLIALLTEMGVVDGEDERGRPRVVEPHLVRKPEERVFYRGFWSPGLFVEAGATASDRAELARFESLVDGWVRKRDAQGRRAFAIPMSQSSDDPEVTALDGVSARTWLAREGFRSERLLWLLDYACRDDFGMRLADTSAWALLFYFAARIEAPGEEASDLITWAEGNYALVRHLSRAARGRMRTSVLALDVLEDSEGVHVLAWDAARDGPLHLLAAHAVVATPRFVARRIVRALREGARADQGFTYAPWLVANLHLTERPASRGSAPAWDNVLYDSPSLGYVSATHQRGSDYGPTVWTYYLPLTDQAPDAARATLLGAKYETYRDAVLLDLSRAHPDLRMQVQRLDVFRWGHAMIRPATGFVWSRARREAALPLGRIHFAHTDLSGVALFEEAFDHGLRAAREVLADAARGSPT